MVGGDVAWRTLRQALSLWRGSGLAASRRRPGWPRLRRARDMCV